MSNASLPPNQNSSVASEWRYEGLGHRIALRKRKNVRGAINRMLTVSNTQGFVLSDEYFDKQVYSRNVSSYLTVHEGDFAYNPYRINVGSIALYDGKEPGVVSPAYVVFHIVSDDLLPEFLFLILKSDEWIASIRPLTMSRGSVRQVLSFSDLQSVNIPLPPLPEQRRIAAVLNAIQDAIAAQEDVIAAAKTFKRSLMQRLFTYGSGREPAETKETEIGEIPAHWEVECIGDVVTIVSGQVDPKVEPYRRMLHIGPENIEEGTGRLGMLRTASDLKLISGKYLFTPDHVVYSKIRPYLMKVCLPNFTGICSADMYPLKPRSRKLTREFLFHFLLTDRFTSQATAHQQRTGIPKINRLQLESIPAIVPPMAEQIAIAEFLDCTDAKIAAEEDRKTALNALFKSMLHQLMTGQIRLFSDAGLLLA